VTKEENEFSFYFGFALDNILGDMPKKHKTSNNLGRDEDIDPKELLRRYTAMKQFLEDNWGRIGRQLRGIRKADDLKDVLNRVPNAKWLPAFHDFPTGCLLHDGSIKVGWRDVRRTREMCEEARNVGAKIQNDYQEIYRAEQNAKAAFEQAVSVCAREKNSKKARRRLQQIREQLDVDNLTNRASQLSKSLRAEQERREHLDKLLSSQEAWFGRNEIVGFVRDRKQLHAKTLENFAKAMAGLPKYTWLYSIRKCDLIPAIENVPPTSYYQVFKMLEIISRRTKSANLKETELKLRKKLLKEDIDPVLWADISPRWHYMTVAFNDCRGKKFRPRDMPYEVMHQFLNHCDRPSLADHEIAKNIHHPYRRLTLFFRDL
jgi:hypothetical protein